MPHVHASPLGAVGVLEDPIDPAALLLPPTEPIDLSEMLGLNGSL